MKACLLHNPAPVDQRPLQLNDAPRPSPADDELLVRVTACGVCRTDLHVVEGELPVRRNPVIPGHQIVGRVEAMGARVNDFKLDQRVGIAWLHHTDGTCRFCRLGQENLCAQAEFTGWTVDGGYAEFALASAAFAYPIPEGFDDLQAAPLLCAGIIGYRSLRLTGLGEAASGLGGKAFGNLRLWGRRPRSDSTGPGARCGGVRLHARPGKTSVAGH